MAAYRSAANDGHDGPHPRPPTPTTNGTAGRGDETVAPVGGSGTMPSRHGAVVVVGDGGIRRRGHFPCLGRTERRTRGRSSPQYRGSTSQWHPRQQQGKGVATVAPVCGVAPSWQLLGVNTPLR